MSNFFFRNNQLLFFFILLIINLTISSQIQTKPKNNSFSKNNHHSFCGVDSLKTNIFKTSPPPTRSNTKRKLSSKVFTPVRIFFDKTFLESQLNTYPDIEGIYPLIISALNRAVKAISEIIKVEQYEENVFIDKLNRDNLRNIGIETWDESLNDLELVHQNYDYVLFAKFITPEDISITATAYPFELAKDTYRPLLGIIEISVYLIYKEKFEEYLKYVFLHELFHAFGFNYKAFKFFPGGEAASVFTETGVAGITRTYVKTERVLNFAKKYFGCDSAKGVELENQGSEGSVNNHWDSRVLLGELMNSEQYEDEFVLSEFTLAFLEDSG